jgi:tripartite-type tricarboxylate transporter receptor subunit TctC
VESWFTTLATASAALSSGAVRALAIAGEQRLAAQPAIPTLREAGIDLVVEHWWGVLAPAGLAPTIAARLAAALQTVLDTPELATRLQPLGVAPAHAAPEQFRALIASDTARWADIVKAAGITVQ